MIDMKARELLRILKDAGCTQVSQVGSHLKIRCGKCTTIVPMHDGEDIKLGTLKSIERHCERCLGKKWLTGR